MTLKELKELLEKIPQDKDGYEITTESGFKKIDGDIFIVDKAKTIIIE